MTDLRGLLAAARQRLADAEVVPEALGRPAAPGRLWRRAPRIERVGAAWRVGALLLTADGDVLAVGEVVRAQPEARRGYTAESARARAQQRAAASRGGFAAGEVVHIGWRRIDLEAAARGEAAGPLTVVDGVPCIRWSAAGDLMLLEAYLAERLALALERPQG